MKTLGKTLQLDNEAYYLKNLEIMNTVLPTKLSEKEMEILSLFMTYENNINGDRFSSIIRKEVMKKLSLSPGGLGNHLASMINKGLLVKTLEGKIEIKPFLFPNPNTQDYHFRLINNAVHK